MNLDLLECQCLAGDCPLHFPWGMDDEKHFIDEDYSWSCAGNLGLWYRSYFHRVHCESWLRFYDPSSCKSQCGVCCKYDSDLTIFLAVLVLGKRAPFDVDALVGVFVDVDHPIILNPCLCSTVLVDEGQSRLRWPRMVEMSLPACGSEWSRPPCNAASSFDYAGVSSKLFSNFPVTNLYWVRF